MRFGAIFTRAISDTRQQAGGSAGIFLLVLSTILGYLFLSIQRGDAEMIGEWESAVSGLVAFFAAAVALLIYNLLAVPFRLHTDI